SANIEENITFGFSLGGFCAEEAVAETGQAIARHRACTVAHLGQSRGHLVGNDHVRIRHSGFRWAGDAAASLS
ncbi:MAG: hypothetical protein WBL96_10840, partial [Pseudolabrys sp.]